MEKTLKDMNLAGVIVYALFLWIFPGLLSAGAGFVGMWILDDRGAGQTELWIVNAVKFLAFMPIIYLILGVWVFIFMNLELGRSQIVSALRTTFVWIVPCLLLAYQVTLIMTLLD